MDPLKIDKNQTIPMKKKLIAMIFFLIFMFESIFSIPVFAGSYAPAADEPGSTAIFMNDERIVAWATGWENYLPGNNVDETWKNPSMALGKAEGTATDIVSLGQGGQITLTFDPPIGNGPTWDFAVFENGINDNFLELAYVEISSDGVNFFRFTNDSLTSTAVGGFGAIDPTDIDGLAGKYRQGFGTPFDLSDLADISPLLDINNIRYIKIIDIIGNGTCLDSSGDRIYDPYPTSGSAGFDLDAIGVLQGDCINIYAPEPPILLSPADGDNDVSLNPNLQTGDFSDNDQSNCEFHMQTQWQISSDSSFSDESVKLNTISNIFLISLKVNGSLLKSGITYYWRARHIDSGKNPSDWSVNFSFTTQNSDDDENNNGIPDSQEVVDDPDLDLLPDKPVSDKYKVFKPITDEGLMSAELDSNEPQEKIEFIESMDPADLPDMPKGAKPDSFLFGVINFRIRVKNPGDSASVLIYFSKSVPDGYGWYKFHPAKGWYLLDDDNVEFSANRKSIRLIIKDGGSNDADGAINGIVLDPGGLGIAASGTPPASGSAGIGGGCFIATAAYGSPMAPCVKLLKKFRDHCLQHNIAGRWFIRTYYRYSPPMADFISKHSFLRHVVRILLTPIVGVCFLILYKPATFYFIAALLMLFFLCLIPVIKYGSGRSIPDNNSKVIKDR